VTHATAEERGYPANVQSRRQLSKNNEKSIEISSGPVSSIRGGVCGRLGDPVFL
jgi:hypothetical protein